MHHAMHTSRSLQRAPEIDVRASEHLRFWCRSLGLTPCQLSCAVSAVGGDIERIRRFVRRTSPQGIH